MAELFTPELAQQRHPILAFFARRPITVAVLLVTVAVLGLISMRLMPLEMIPAGIEHKSLSVSVDYNRAGGTVSPLVVERELTLIIEGELSTIAGITELTATSSSSGARFNLEFDPDRNMDEAYAEVWAACERASTRLPDTTGRIQVRRWRADSGSWPVAFVNFSWEDSAEDPHIKLEQVIQPHLESIDGIASVNFFGTYRKFIAVDLDPEKVRAYGVDIADLLQRLRGDNFRAPAGKTTVEEGAGPNQRHERDVYLVADSRFASVAEMEALPVRPGLALADITRHGVMDGKAHNGVYETYSVSTYVRVNRNRGATAMLFKTGESNTVVVGDRIDQGLKSLHARPEMQGFTSRVAWNQGNQIKESIENLLWTLFWGGVLAFIVMLVFLKSWRLSLMIALSIPLSMTMALAVMFFFDQTINLLVLMGFTLAAGMLLDNSIVVAENVYRRNMLGEQPYAAAVRGAGEVGLALVLATSTTVIVFITVVFMLENRTLSFFMGKIGMPVCLSIGFSILLAIGVIPMTMFGTGLLRADKSSMVRKWFVGLRTKLGAGMDKPLPAPLIAAPLLVLWEMFALVLGRNERGLPGSPIVDALARWYELAVRRMMPARWLIALAVLLVTFGGVIALQSSSEQTDQNQGNRDSIQLRIGFDGGTDIMVSKHALQITGIAPGSAAERGRFKVGDFILRYNGRPIESPEDLKRLEQAGNGAALVPVLVARGKLSGTLGIEPGPSGIVGMMADTEPLRDAIWQTYVFDVEDILLGREDAAEKREAATQQGMDPAQAKLLFGRTPDEAQQDFGIQTMTVSFSSGRAQFWIYLHPDRVGESNDIYKRMIAALPERAGVDIRGEFSGSTSSEVSVRISGPDTERLLALADEVIVRLSGIEGLEGLRVDTEEGIDEVTLAVDRQRAAAFGIEPNALSQVMGFQLSGTTLRDYQRNEVMLPLRVRFAPPEDQSGNPRDPGLSDVAETRLAGAGGSSVAAKAVTSTSGLARPQVGEVRRINRKTSLRVVGTTSTEDLQRIESQVRAAMMGVKFPAGYSQELGGRFGRFGQQFTDLWKSLLWAAVLVFLVMCFLFESVLKPLCILFASIPGAMLGGFGLLYVSSTPVDGITMLGLLVLVGVVVNNGIVLVDLINRLRAEGIPRTAAVEVASRQRLRPIILTSLTTAFGLIPMALGDAKFVGMPYYPMGRMVLGGILVSMLYTLVLVPLIYTILDDIGETVKGWFAILFARRAKGGSSEAPPAPASAD
ncbi:MAG: efflux RND transporter permease subunit [Planctomycetes bacterium]|nr:efflux RND transporter permease subunit [Planctomycetota bacterium]MCW8134495.1 efflux RND transporter permease subunit [Planctomycetota bacterium]